jgi:hypothetical protein
MNTTVRRRVAGLLRRRRWHDGRPVPAGGAVFRDTLDGSWPPDDEPWNFTAAATLSSQAGTLDTWYAAADIRRRQAEETRLDIPVGLARPYAPEPEPVSYPPLSFKADYHDLPMFRAVVRGACRAGLTGLGVAFAPPLPDFDLGRFDAPRDEVAA